MIVLGHRGGGGDGWPMENTLPAFSRALSEGAVGVELDVRLCASGEPVVLHDPTLARVTNGADLRPVCAVRRADLPRLEGGACVPDLDAALDLLRGRVANVELKSDVPSQLALVRAVARSFARCRDVDLVVSSFDPRIVLALAAIVPAIPRGMLVGERGGRLASALPFALRRALSAAHLEDVTITPRRVERLHLAGLRVAAWTVNDVDRARALRAMGVAWLITDRPGAMVRALAA